MPDYNQIDAEFYDFLTPEERHTIPYQRLRSALTDENSPGVARELIEAHPGTLDGFSTKGEGHPVQCVPIEGAACNGDVEMVRWLLGRGAAADARRDDRDGTALYGAAEQAAKAWTLDDPGVAKFFRVIRLLIDAGADPHLRCSNGTPDELYRMYRDVGLLDALAEFERRHGPG